MRNKPSKTNQRFMLGSFVMMAALLIVIFLFLMWAFKIYQNRDEKRYSDRYEIVIGNSALDAPLTLYLNDSLLFNGTPVSSMTLSIDRFSEDNTILAVDVETDRVSLLSVPPESGTITIEKDGSDFTASFIKKNR